MRSLVLAAGALLVALTAPVAQAQPKVLKYAFQTPETGFDPGRTSDLYSAYVNAAIYDPLMTFDYLARPYKLIPNSVLAEPPKVEEQGTLYTFRLKPGVYFADDPAFKGKKRELIAEDYAYSLKRHWDPELRSQNLYLIEKLVTGMSELAERSRNDKRFDYAAPVEGIKVLDRYTLQMRLREPNYTFLMTLANPAFAAVPREVVEAHGTLMEHPVGTGPYKLGAWRRGSRIVLERNPHYREEYWHAEPAADDTDGQAIARRMRGKRLPIIDTVEIDIVAEQQPRWLSFLNEQHDFIERAPAEYVVRAFANGRLSGEFARRGIQMDRLPALDITFTYFNMEDPVWGGYTPEKVALRRAVVMAYSNKDEINIFRKGQAIAAQSLIPPGAAGYDPNFRATPAEHDVPRARALLDMFGYVDKDGDGWRDLPDGSPLVFVRTSSPEQWNKEIDELWKRALDDVNIKLDVRKQKWSDSLKEANVGKLQTWSLAQSLSVPDAEEIMSNLYGPNAGPGNLARFRNAEYDRLYEEVRRTPHGEARNDLFRKLNRIMLAYAPWKANAHRIYTNFSHRWVIGYKMNPLLRSVWKFVDIDLVEQAKRAN
jgi:ABC-type transport system substrate-binding protein